MKTINELSESLCVSRQTLYNTCKKVGISIDELTTKRNGKERLFDELAEKKIREMLGRNGTRTVNAFDKLDNIQAELDKARLTITEKENEISETRKELAEAEKRISNQAEELEKLRAEADKLRENNDILIKTNATNAVTIQTLQAERSQALLTAGVQKKTGRIRKAWRALIGKDDME